MDRLLAISSVMGALSLAQNFGLYLLARDVFGVGLAQTQTMMFLAFIAGGHLLLFVTRSRHPLWRPPYPSWQLFTAIVGTQIAGVCFVTFGWLMPSISWAAIGLIWLYEIAWMMIMNFAKLGTYRLVEQRSRHHRRFLGVLTESLQPAATQRRRRGS